MFGVSMYQGLLLRRTAVAVTVALIVLRMSVVDVLLHGRRIGSGQELSCA